MKTKEYWIFVVVAVAAFVVGRWTVKTAPIAANAQQSEFVKDYCEANSKPTIAKTDKVKLIDVTLGQLIELFGRGGQLTSLQKQEEFRKYKGGSVRWKGSLASVSSYRDNEIYTVFDHLLEPAEAERAYGHRLHLHFNVRVTFPVSQKDKLLSAQKGSFVTYQGRLSDYTSVYDGYFQLTNGRVISIEP